MDCYEIRFQFGSVETANFVMAHAQRQENVDCQTRGFTSLDLIARSLDDLAVFMRDIRTKGLISDSVCRSHLALIERGRTETTA